MNYDCNSGSLSAQVMYIISWARLGTSAGEGVRSQFYLHQRLAMQLNEAGVAALTGHSELEGITALDPRLPTGPSAGTQSAECNTFIQ